MKYLTYSFEKQLNQEAFGLTCLLCPLRRLQFNKTFVRDIIKFAKRKNIIKVVKGLLYKGKNMYKPQDLKCNFKFSKIRNQNKNFIKI